MFDIGLIEMLVVALVGLLVLGPERLPGAIRTSAKWLNKLKQGFNRIKAEIDEELGTQELQAQLRTDSITSSFKKDKDVLEALDQQAQSNNIQFLDSLVMPEEKSPAPGE